VSASVYWNDTTDGIYFTPSAFYSPASPPPTWPAGLPTSILALLALAIPPVLLPSEFTYLNFGKVKDKGIEIGVDTSLNRYVNVFANYSYQWKPVVSDLPTGTSIADVNCPPRTGSTSGSISANRTSSATCR